MSCGPNKQRSSSSPQIRPLFEVSTRRYSHGGAGVSAVLCFGTKLKLTHVVGAILMIFFCSKIGHEKWQLIGFTAIQTALIGSMASVGVDDRTQAICTVLFAASMVVPPQLISFTMLSLTLDDQNDM